MYGVGEANDELLYPGSLKFCQSLADRIGAADQLSIEAVPQVAQEC